MKSPIVYLADLRYNYSGVLANDCMPLGVAYMKAVMDRDVPEARSRIFAYPDRLYDAIRETPPDVLMLSNYLWNEALSVHIAKLAKRINPEMLVVLGGPNISQEPERQRTYLAGMEPVDLYVLGEGDFLAAEIVKQFIESGLSLAAFRKREIPSSVYRGPEGEIRYHPMWDRKRNIDEIPSPWLTGILDEFFDGKLAPIIETNRGCPFTCTFCSQGTKWYAKINHFGLPRLREEIFYIAKRIREHSPYMRTLRIADSNYGMYERDVEISGYLGETQKEYGWPTFIDATTGKNRPERVIRSLEKVNGAMWLYQSVQSLDEDVLRNVKRTNISLDAFEKLGGYIRGRGLRSNTDLILGLPGETFESHMKGVRGLLDSGVSQVTNFQLMMLKGTELETLKARERFKFRSGFRILPKNFAVIDGEKVFDVEEIVCATDTMPFEDYIRARKVALASAAFWREDSFEHVVAFAGTLGIRRSECMDAILAEMDADPGEVRDFVKGFVAETVGELFPTREACIEFYNQEENFQKLQRGEVGDNLMRKYHAIASFHIWPAICACAMRAIRKLIVSRNLEKQLPGFEEFWEDFSAFTELSHAHGRTTESILAPVETELGYNIESWIAAGTPADPSPFKLPRRTRASFRLEEKAADELRAAFAVWTTELKGLTKLVTRVQVEWQQRRCQLRTPLHPFADPVKRQEVPSLA